MATVDVIVPSYNYARYLPRCVESILAQDQVDVRVLIVDDASTDETPAVAEQLMRNDARVEYRRHTQNAGHIATYNEGLFQWAKRDYTLLISADDLLVPGALRRATTLLDENPTASFAFGTVLTFYEDAYPNLEPVGDRFDFEVVPASRFLKHCFLRGNPVPTATSIVRTSAQHRVGPYDARLPHSADMHMWMRLAAAGDVIAIRPIQGLYRRHVTSMSRAYYTQVNSDRREVMLTCDDVVAQLANRFPEVTALNIELRKRLAWHSFSTASSAFDEGNTEALNASLDFAKEAFPPIWRSIPWWRLQAKRMLGRQFAECLNRFRNAPAAAVSLHYQIPREIGWWSA